MVISKGPEYETVAFGVTREGRTDTDPLTAAVAVALAVAPARGAVLRAGAGSA
ncbi:hypothetical protein GCM10023107_73620 [Actinoplanes octamycinicus]